MNALKKIFSRRAPRIECVPVDVRTLDADLAVLRAVSPDDRLYRAVILVLSQQRAKYWIAAENGDIAASERARGIAAALHALEDARTGAAANKSIRTKGTPAK